VHLAAVILAAGEGKRLRTKRAKVLHEAGGRPLIDHVLAALDPLRPDRTVVVVGHLRDQVEQHLAAASLRLVVQEPPRGTGDALAKAVPMLPERGEVLVLAGDAPLVSSGSLAALVEARRAAGAAAAMLTAVLPDGGAYGRILRRTDGLVEAIVEARDASPEQLATHEVNAGCYAFDSSLLRPALGALRPANDQQEYYLTDVVGLLTGAGHAVLAVPLADPTECIGVNTRAELAEVHRQLNSRVLERLQAEGVTILDPATTWVEASCLVGPDTVLEPGVHLRRGCTVGAGCWIGAGSVLEGVAIPDGARVTPLSIRRE